MPSCVLRAERVVFEAVVRLMLRWTLVGGSDKTGSDKTGSDKTGSDKTVLTESLTHPGSLWFH